MLQGQRCIVSFTAFLQFKGNKSLSLLRLTFRRAVAVTGFASAKGLGSSVSLQSGRGLTWRSTGHFAAVQVWAPKS